MKNQELTKAIIAVMQSVKGVEKNLTVGSGNNLYKGVSDKDVKQIIGKAMSENGLTIVPIQIEPKIKVDRWTETQFWNQREVEKQKQSVFTEVKVTYLLMHESGESMEIVGYGHGVDSLDKSAGKATTYALKYALLYTFLVPTGAIDDADVSHSDEAPEPTKIKKVTLDDERFDNALKQIEEGNYTVEKMKKAFTLTKAQRDKLKEFEEALKDEEPEQTPEEKKLDAELEKVADESKHQ